MKTFFSDKSILLVGLITLIGVILSVAFFTEQTPKDTSVYLLGRARISYIVPITPTPPCRQTIQIDRFTYTKAC